MSLRTAIVKIPEGPFGGFVIKECDVASFIKASDYDMNCGRCGHIFWKHLPAQHPQTPIEQKLDRLEALLAGKRK
jgi:hypothetical protein